MKTVPYLTSYDPHVAHIGVHMQFHTMGHIAQDNPMRRGLKLLTVSAGATDDDRATGYLNVQYAANDGRWQRRASSVWVAASTPDEELTGAELARAVRFYSKFLWTPSLRHKVVVPIDDEGVVLLQAINQPKGYNLRELSNLDELTGFQSDSQFTKVANVTSIEDFLGSND